MEIPPVKVEIIRKPLRLAPEVKWCTKCGEDTAGYGREELALGCCPRCGGALMPAVQALRIDEYFVAG